MVEAVVTNVIERFGDEEIVYTVCDPDTGLAATRNASASGWTLCAGLITLSRTA